MKRRGFLKSIGIGTVAVTTGAAVTEVVPDIVAQKVEQPESDVTFYGDAHEAVTVSSNEAGGLPDLFKLINDINDKLVKSGMVTS